MFPIEVWYGIFIATGLSVFYLSYVRQSQPGRQSLHRTRDENPPPRKETVPSSWDGAQPLVCCQTCGAFNQTGYALCQRCTTELKGSPVFTAESLATHFDM